MSDNLEAENEEPVMEFEFSEESLEVVPEEEVIEVDMSFGSNMVTYLDQSVVDTVGSERLDTYTNYKNSRQQWEDKIKKGIQWLGLNTEGQGNTNVEGACTAVHPLLIENIIKFQAKAIQELWPAKGPVRTKVRGYVDVAREEVANRVRTYMNYQLTEQVPGFYSDLERNLFRIGFMGVGIRKVGWNGPSANPDPTIVHAENFFIDPAVTHLKDADEYIEIMELSSRKMSNLLEAGTFYSVNEDEAEESLEPNEITEAIARAQGFDMSLERKGFTVGEAHCYINFEGDDPYLPEGGTAPYICLLYTSDAADD